MCYLSPIWRHAVQISAILRPSKRKSFWRPTFYPCRSRLRRTAVYWRQEYHQGSKRIEQGICVPIHLFVDASSSLRIDPRPQRSSIPVSLQTICESTRATSDAEFRQRQDFQIVMQGNSQDYKSRRSVAFSYKQTNRVEFHHRTSPMVGRLLGTISSRY